MSEWRPLPEQTRPSLTRAGAGGPRGRLHEVAQQTIDAVAQEVPDYHGTLDDTAQAILAQAVERALSGFLALAAADQDPSAPLAPALQGAFALGQGEARRGRPMDALLAAYRVGARVSWRGLAGAAVEAGLPADEVVLFAELVFAYIDALSAASVAGHAEELAVADRVRQRNLERLGHGLLVGAPADQVQAAAQRAEWTPPAGLMAVVLPESRVADVLARIDSRTLQPVDDIPGLESGVSRPAGARPGCAVPRRPGPGARRRRRRHRTGPAVAGGQQLLPAGAARMATRTGGPARRRPGLGAGPGTRSRLASSTPRRCSPSCSSAADPDALADLRARALAPLADLRPAVAARLTRDPAGVAAAPRPTRRRRRRAVRPPADRPLPDGPGPRAVRRRARRPESDPRTHPGPHPPAWPSRDRATRRTLDRSAGRPAETLWG